METPSPPKRTRRAAGAAAAAATVGGAAINDAAMPPDLPTALLDAAGVVPAASAAAPSHGSKAVKKAARSRGNAIVESRANAPKLKAGPVGTSTPDPTVDLLVPIAPVHKAGSGPALSGPGPIAALTPAGSEAAVAPPPGVSGGDDAPSRAPSSAVFPVAGSSGTHAPVSLTVPRVAAKRSFRGGISPGSIAAAIARATSAGGGSVQGAAAGDGGGKAATAGDGSVMLSPAAAPLTLPPARPLDIVGGPSAMAPLSGHFFPGAWPSAATSDEAGGQSALSSSAAPAPAFSAGIPSAGIPSLTQRMQATAASGPAEDEWWSVLLEKPKQKKGGNDRNLSPIGTHGPGAQPGTGAPLSASMVSALNPSPQNRLAGSAGVASPLPFSAEALKAVALLGQLGDASAANSSVPSQPRLPPPPTSAPTAIPRANTAALSPQQLAAMLLKPGAAAALSSAIAAYRKASNPSLGAPVPVPKPDSDNAAASNRQ